MNQSLTDLIYSARPLIQSWIDEAAGRSAVASTGPMGDQYALYRDGSRSLQGNLPVDAGVTIDGVDVSELAAAPAYIVAATSPILGAERVAAGGALITLTDAGAGGAFTIAVDNTKLSVTGGKLDKSGTGTLSLYTNTAGTYTVEAPASGTMALGANTLSVGSINLYSGAQHTHAIATSSNPGAAAAILASDGAGGLTLVTVTASTKMRTPLIDTAAGALTLQPASDLLLSPASNLVKLASGKSLQSDNYASQTTGMAMTHAGAGDFRYLFADELHAKKFITDLEQALAGGQIIAKSVAMLYSDFTIPAAGASGTFIVRDLPSATGMRVFEERDITGFRNFSRSAGSLNISDAWGEVYLDTSYGVSGFDPATKTQRYTFVRRTGVTIDDQNNDPITDQSSDPILSSNIATPEGAMAGSTVVYADSIVIDYGKNQSGIHEVNAIDGAYGLNSPYAQTVSWSIHPKNKTVRTRLGNLRGIFGVSDEYGLYAGSGTSTADQYIRASSAGVLLNNVPLQLYSGGVQRVNIDSAGANVWFSPDGGTTKSFAWDGSSLTLRNSTLVLTGSGTITASASGIFGVDVSAAPNFSILNSTIAVNGETLNAGDVLLGSNASGKANLYYDRTNGQLKFRAGTGTVSFIDTTGGFVTGSSVPYARYDQNGLTIVLGASTPWTGVASANGITFHQNADRTGTRYGYLGIINVSGATFMTLNSNSVLSLETATDYIRLGSSSEVQINSGSGRNVYITAANQTHVWGNGGGTGIHLRSKTQVYGQLDVDTYVVAGQGVTGSAYIASPSGYVQAGTTWQWKLGGYTAGAPGATGYVGVTIGGTNYKLLAST